MHGTKPDPAPPDRTGLIQAMTACLIWGLLPLYFAVYPLVDAGEVVASRILWSLIAIAILVMARRSWPALRSALRNRRAVAMLMLSAGLISINWLVYVWSVQHHHVLAASLGYFLNPLVNVAFGVVLLGERLNRVQLAAVGLAAAGVLILAGGASDGLWISLTLAFSFAGYALVRKVAPVESIEGLAIETMILSPISLGYLVWLGRYGALAFGSGAGVSLWLAGSGLVTAAPLILFASAARRLTLSLVGLLQYIAPTLQFMLAVTVFREPLLLPQIICFALIWTGLILYTGHGWVRARSRRRRTATFDRA